MKPISYRQEMEDTEQICTPEPQRVLLSFNLGNRATMTVIVQFSRSVMSDSLRPHESQHTRHRCPSPTPGVHSDSRPSSQ